jgi:hypothetical protein
VDRRDLSEEWHQRFDGSVAPVLAPGGDALRGDGSPFRAAPAHPLCPSPVAPPLRLYIPLFRAPDAPSFPRPTTPHARARTRAAAACSGLLELRTLRPTSARGPLLARAPRASHDAPTTPPWRKRTLECKRSRTDTLGALDMPRQAWMPKSS